MHKFIEQYFKNFSFKHELNFFRKKIDFTFIDKNEKLHAIELKVKDWRKSIPQIETNQLCANYSYLGIWHEYKELVPKSIFKKNHFGLISINKNGCELLIKAKKSPILNKDLSTKLKLRIKEG